MVNCRIARLLILTALLLTGLYGQVTADLERRIAELEDKMRLIDPAFARENRAQDLTGRLQALESKMDEVLAGRQPGAAAQPPQSPCPITRISPTSSWLTANSRAADTPWKPRLVSYGGASAAMLRTTNISPGLASKICAGSTRLSAQERIITLGLWPSAMSAQRSRSCAQSLSRKRR